MHGCAPLQYHEDGRVKSLSMETALQADNTAVAVTLQFSTAAGLPTSAAAFDSAAGHMSFANGERCGVELCWRQRGQQRHPAAPFPHTVTVRPVSQAGWEKASAYRLTRPGYNPCIAWFNFRQCPRHCGVAFSQNRAVIKQLLVLSAAVVCVFIKRNTISAR